MSSPLDNLFGIHTQALGVWQKRAEVIASNLANADTPGHQAKDVDFQKILNDISGKASDDLPLAASHASHFENHSIINPDDIPLSWRRPLQPSMDGNTVDAQIEQAAFASNSVHYQASLTFLTGRIRTLRTAITGGAG